MDNLKAFGNWVAPHLVGCIVFVLVYNLGFIPLLAWIGLEMTVEFFILTTLSWGIINFAFWISEICKDVAALNLNSVGLDLDEKDIFDELENGR